MSQESPPIPEGLEGERQPTPFPVVKLMTMMTMGEGDHRDKTVCDCCIGTGRMMLEAYNYSYRLYGQDVNNTVIMACLVNAALYAPWMYRPFAFWESDVRDPKAFSDSISEQYIRPDLKAESNEKARSYLSDTEYDTDQGSRFAPIIKRRKTKGDPNYVAGKLH